MQFSCDVRLLGPTVLQATLRGVLDAGTSIELEMSLSSYLKNAEIRKIILDVQDLTFISSSGLRVMMVIIKALTPRQGKLYLVGAASQIAGLIRMSGMMKWIFLKNTIQECLDD